MVEHNQQEQHQVDNHLGTHQKQESGKALIGPQGKRHSKSKSKSNSLTKKYHNGLPSPGPPTPNSNISHLSVDIELERYPFCIVWTPLPIITWLLPIIGHTGIANSKGIIYDFSDDFNVSVDNFSFGSPTKYFKFHSHLIPNGPTAWDKAIQETSDYYNRTRHSLFFNNCHQYIAGVLNKVKYENRTDWSQVEVWWNITFRSSYSSFLGFIRQWWPFTVITISTIVFLIIAF